MEMQREAVECERTFAEDVLSFGVNALCLAEMVQYLEYAANRRLEALGIDALFDSKSPFAFMELQDVQEST